MTISKKIVVSAMALAILAGGTASIASDTTLSDTGTTAIVADAATLSAAKLPSKFTVKDSTVNLKWAYDKNWSAPDNEYQIKYSLDDGKTYKDAGYAFSNGTKGYSKNITLKSGQVAKIMIRKSRVTSQKTGTREYGKWTTFYLMRSNKTVEIGTKKNIELGVAQHTKNANSVVLYVNPAPGTKSSVRFTLKKRYPANPNKPAYSGTVSLKLNNKTYKKTLYYDENLSAVKNNTVPTTTVKVKDITATVLVGKTQVRIYKNGLDNGKWNGKRNNVARTFALM